jgi:hypothetical protein
MLTRFASAMVITMAGLLATASSARGDPGWGSVDCSTKPGPGCELIAEMSEAQGRPSVPDTGTHEEASDAFECRYVPVDQGDSATPQPEGPGGWFRLLCSADGKDTANRPPVWIPAGQQAAPSMTPEQVAMMAKSQLRLPSPSIAVNPAGEQLVHLPTWLWLREGWRTTSASASVPGITVTAVAEPATATWSTGDGMTVTCSGPGTAFTAGHDPKSASPDCGHTYRRSSKGLPGEVYAATVAVRWNVRWSGAGQTGVFPGLTTTASTTLRVAESQALNSR